MKQTLELKFSLADGKDLTISIADPKVNLTDAIVAAAMQTIVAENVFAKDGVPVVAKKSARLIGRTEQLFNV